MSTGSSHDDTDFEFVEVFNAGPNTVDLSRAQFTSGIDFVFPEGSAVRAGEHIVIARKLEAFLTRYKADGMTILGDYEGKLQNSGETLSLQGSVGEPLFQFTFGDWYEQADGQGHSLVLVDPYDHEVDWDAAGSWRSSSEVYGSPGQVDPKSPAEEGGDFVRGDANSDSRVNISDPIYLLIYLFRGGQALACEASGDSNGDASVNISDANYLLNYLFAAGPEPGAPFPDCGPRPESETLECETSGCE